MIKRKSSRRLWTEAERDYLKEHFPENYTDTICSYLNRSYSSVSQQAALLGLSKSDGFKKLELKRQADRLRIAGSSFRYTKGRVPENKGKQMAPDVYEKCKATMFKKGTIPPNAYATGAEVLRKDKSGHKYWMIKIPDKSKLVYKHIFLWEQLHGKLLKGFNVVFKNGNSEDCQIENLECISNEELMYRNSKQKYPLPLIPSLIIINKLKKKIHEKQNN